MTTELDRAYEEMGEVNERLYKPIIQSIYGEVVKTSYKYSRIDFVGDRYSGELKSRNLSINTFNETMIGYNKIENGFKTLNFLSTHRVYFWFAFKEGLYVWELTQENFELNGGDSQKRMGGTSNRGRDDFKEHYYIQNKYLTKIDDTPVWVHQKVAENSNTYNSSLKSGVCYLRKSPSVLKYNFNKLSM
jgi:hypothetical protein